jgi:hypothetical protein
MKRPSGSGCVNQLEKIEFCMQNNLIQQRPDGKRREPGENPLQPR